VSVSDHHRRFVRQLAIFKKTWAVAASASALEGSTSNPNWNVTTEGPNWCTEANVELLAWDDLVNAGAKWLDQEVVRDGNLVTSRGPQDLKPFVKEVVEQFAAGAPLQRDGASASPEASSPQANEPPKIVIEAMRWMPRPSFRTIVLIALGFALFAPRSTKRCLRWSK